ncbi:MAG: Flp pilus assembly complex ATPase component TadA, partial [Phycisphaerales bacterium]|nr:Flp pilus assembly complex ATPase component TadA [Phycisphaerales bacterium]
EKARFRVAVFKQKGNAAMVCRLIPNKLLTFEQIGLPHKVVELLDRPRGLLLVTGPAGSGKTTTVYAGLRELSESAEEGRSLVSIEDPIEAVIKGVAQSQVQPTAGFTYEAGLRSLLRQDPDVILVGEIRDSTTAELVFQAALSGHLVLSTYHAGSAAGAMQRLVDMGIEPYQLRSGLLAVLSQRLLRRLCECAVETTSPSQLLGLEITAARKPAGCPS